MTQAAFYLGDDPTHPSPRLFCRKFTLSRLLLPSSFRSDVATELIFKSTHLLLSVLSGIGAASPSPLSSPGQGGWGAGGQGGGALLGRLGPVLLTPGGQRESFAAASIHVLFTVKALIKHVLKLVRR